MSKIVINHYKTAIAEKSDFIYYMNPDNIDEWYILLRNISGNNNEFEGGEYLIKIVCPPEYPNAPPSFYAITPNGVYEPGGKICVSIGEFHSDNYRAVLGISGFIMNIVGGLIQWNELVRGVRIVGNIKIANIKELAKKSVDFNNENHGELIKQMKSTYEEYSKKWQIEPVQNKVVNRFSVLKKLK